MKSEKFSFDCEFPIRKSTIDYFKCLLFINIPAYNFFDIL